MKSAYTLLKSQILIILFHLSNNSNLNNNNFLFYIAFFCIKILLRISKILTTSPHLFTGGSVSWEEGVIYLPDLITEVPVSIPG